MLGDLYLELEDMAHLVIRTNSQQSPTLLSLNAIYFLRYLKRRLFKQIIQLGAIRVQLFMFNEFYSNKYINRSLLKLKQYGCPSSLPIHNFSIILNKSS